MAATISGPDRRDDPAERLEALHELEGWLETPMLLLSFVWLLLVLVELVWGTSMLLEVFGTVIWIVFIAEFALRLPSRRTSGISCAAISSPSSP